MEMRIVRNSGASNALEVATIHKDKSIEWLTLTNVFEQSYEKGFDVFDQINRYWKSLPDQTQLEIFEIYARIANTFRLHWDQESLAMALRPLIAELFFKHPQSAVQQWTDLYGETLFPSNVKAEFDLASGMTGTRERTYLREDYKRLVPLAIVMRIMIPVWGMFITRNKKELGTLYKEYQAFQLLSKSSILQEVAMQRLQTFVEHSIMRDHSLDAAIISGVGTQDFPMWLLSHVVVRRLCYADVRGLDGAGSSNNLVSGLYNFIEQKVSSLDSQIGTIKPKVTDTSSAEGDNNLSKLEGFKIKQAVAIGDIAVIGVYIDGAKNYALSSKQVQKQTSPHSLIKKLSGQSDTLEFANLVKQAHSSAILLMNESLTQPQVALAGWVLSPWISVRAVPHLKKLDVIAMIALAQAWLWQNKHYDLSILISALPKFSQRDDVHIVSGEKGRLPKATQDAIRVEFPYLKRSNSRAKNVKMNNPTEEAIEFVAEAFGRYHWISSLPTSPDWNLGPDYIRGSRYNLPHNLRELLATVVLQVNQQFGENTQRDLNAVSI